MEIPTNHIYQQMEKRERASCRPGGWLIGRQAVWGIDYGFVNLEKAGYRFPGLHRGVKDSARTKLIYVIAVGGALTVGLGGWPASAILAAAVSSHHDFDLLARVSQGQLQTVRA